MSQSSTPGCLLKIRASPFTGTECRLAIALEFTPEICMYGRLGGLPSERNIADASARFPFSKSTSMVTVPSVADTSELLTCPNRFNAFIAFDAQSGQSMSWIGQQTFCVPPYSPKTSMSINSASTGVDSGITS